RGKLFVELRQPFVFVSALPRVQSEEQQFLLIEAEVDLLQVVEGAYEQPRADEQQQRQRYLQDDQSFAQSRHRAGSAPALLDRRRQIQSGRAQRWRQAEQNSGQHRDDDGESQHAPIYAEVDFGGQKARVPVCQRRERALAPEREDDAERAAQRREQDALGQQLPDQTSPPGADRKPHADLRPSQRRARQQQVRHVGAGDQQYERDDAEQPVDRGRIALATLHQPRAPRSRAQSRIILRARLRQVPAAPRHEQL